MIAPSAQCAWRYGGGARRVISNSKKHSSGDGTLNPGLRMVAGAVAGIIAMSSTYHLDMVRGRLTVQEGRSEQYRGIAHAYREIISKVPPPFLPPPLLLQDPLKAAHCAM